MDNVWISLCASTGNACSCSVCRIPSGRRVGSIPGVSPHLASPCQEAEDKED
ncbi:MAG: hypothetical protein MJZ51_04290 [Bacteroidales bacterium]|nr:hypothetical protein [Bacteroidales bacterium]